MISVDYEQVVYNGNGSTYAWPYSFPIDNGDVIRLILIDTDGTEINIEQDYFVDVPGSTVYYPGYAPGAEPPVEDQPPKVQTGQKLIVYRDTEITQDSNLGDSWPFNVIEKGLDKLTMILQEKAFALARCLKISQGQAAEIDNYDPTVPMEANKVICGNAAGDGFEAREALMEVNGAWDGEGRQIHSVADPTGDQDAATKNYVDTLTDNNFMKLQPDGNAWESRNLPISNVGGPVLVKDAATKDYVDRILNGFVLAGDSRTVPFDTLVQLKASDIEAGQIAFTLGYSDVNDGGAGVYTIRNATPSDVDDGGSIIILDNGNVAELITDGTVNVKQFGAKGDGVTDDTNAFQNLNGRIAYIPEGTYLISSVTYGNNTVISGAGMGKTIIKQTLNCDDDMIIFDNCPKSGLRDMSLLGRGYDVEETATHSYLFQSLLKIMATNNADTYGNSWCLFEHLSIREAPMNGMVLLGNRNGLDIDYRFNDERFPVTGYNWVHHFNDIRIEKCKRWCMIDQTTDNKYANFYVSDGNVGCMGVFGGGSNLYVNFKIDQPLSQGSDGTESGYVDGACLLMRSVTNSYFANLDVQSAFYAGVKLYYCRGLRMEGGINSCGRYSPDGGTCLMIDDSNYIETHFVYSSAGYTQARNISISNTCHHIKCYMVEVTVAANINNKPASCFIIDETKKLTNFYNDSFEVTEEVPNLLKSPFCEDIADWTVTSGVTLDTSSKVVGTNSFALQGTTGVATRVSQTITGLKPNTFYAFACEVNIGTLDTSSSSTPTPYLMAVDNDGNNYSDNLGYEKAENTLGKHFIYKVGKTTDVGTLEFICTLYNCNALVYAGRFVAFCISGYYPYGNDIIDAWRTVYSQLEEQMDDTTNQVTYSGDCNNTLALIEMLISRA